MTPLSHTIRGLKTSPIGYPEFVWVTLSLDSVIQLAHARI